jgi:hypothetical protein
LFTIYLFIIVYCLLFIVLDSTKMTASAQKVLAGSLGGAMEAVLLQPLDVTKTRLQLDRSVCLHLPLPPLPPLLSKSSC